MTTAPITDMGGKERQVGQVHIKVTVTNSRDEALASAGHLPAESVRSTTISRVLVDTGALQLCLPVEIVAQLGLRLAREVEVMTAAGPTTMRIMRDVELEVLGRSGAFECIELPAGTMPLLGAVPMEVLGLQPDLQNQRLIQLPEHGPGTYHLVYQAR